MRNLIWTGCQSPPAPGFPAGGAEHPEDASQAGHEAVRVLPLFSAPPGADRGRFGACAIQRSPRAQSSAFRRARAVIHRGDVFALARGANRRRN